MKDNFIKNLCSILEPWQFNLLSMTKEELLTCNSCDGYLNFLNYIDQENFFDFGRNYDRFIDGFAELEEEIIYFEDCIPKLKYNGFEIFVKYVLSFKVV